MAAVAAGRAASALTQDEYHAAVKAQTRAFAARAALFHVISSFLILVAVSPATAGRGQSGSPQVA